MWTISWCQPLIRRADPGRIPPIRRNSDAIPRLPLFLRIKFLFTLFLASASRSSPPTSYFCCRLFACVFSASLVFFFVSSFLPTHLHLLSLSLSLSPTSPRRRLSPLPALLRLCGLACACGECVLCFGSLYSVVGSSPPCLVACYASLVFSFSPFCFYFLFLVGNNTTMTLSLFVRVYILSLRLWQRRAIGSCL